MLDDTFKYKPRRRFITITEQKLFRALERGAKGKFRIFANTRLADIIRPSEYDRDKWLLFMKIRSKHVDFIITDLEFHILRAVELNDYSHNTPKRRERDQFVANALYTAHIPLTVFKPQNEYTENEISALFSNLNNKLSPTSIGKCPGCEVLLRYTIDERLGAKMNCPKCGHMFVITEVVAEVTD